MQAFIRQKGVTRGPGFGTPELAALNARRATDEAAERSREGGRRWRKRARR